MSSRTNQVRIAGRRLRWSNHYSNLNRERSWGLEREDEKPLYFVSKVRGKKAGRRGSFAVELVSRHVILGRKRTLREAKNLAEEHFAKKHHGQVEGHWTSHRKTYELSNELAEQVKRAPKTDQYPGWVPEICPFCDSRNVEIEHPPHTMAFDHQLMVCLYCGETVYSFQSYCMTDAQRVYCGLSGSPLTGRRR